MLILSIAVRSQQIRPEGQFCRDTPTTEIFALKQRN